MIRRVKRKEGETPDEEKDSLHVSIRVCSRNRMVLADVSHMNNIIAAGMIT